MISDKDDIENVFNNLFGKFNPDTNKCKDCMMCQSNQCMVGTYVDSDECVLKNVN